MRSFIFFMILFMFNACSVFNKVDTTLFNLTPDEWFAQILKDIRDKNLPSADEHYTSFVSEHINSDYLPQLMLIMANAHTAEEKYIMANFYLDEYIKRFADTKNVEYAKFLKIKANFDSFSKPNRNQKLLIDSIKDIKIFLEQYPSTQYKPLIQTMLAKLSLAQVYLDEEISNLYERKGKDESAQIYKEKVENSGISADEFIKPTLPWYMTPFE